MARKNSKNLPTLIIVESPSKGRTIEKYLGKDYVVRASYGHIRDLASNKHSGLGVDIDNNFKPKYQILSDKKDKVQSIIDAATLSKEILIASDPDREGEAIAWHLAHCLDSTGKKISRVLFHEITKDAVTKAVANPIQLNSDLFDAQQARRVLDRIVGFKIQPYLINKIEKKTSAGRVQSVAVRMVVEREREIENFKPETYWDISAELAKTAKSDSFSAKYSKRITEEKLAKDIKEDLEKSKFTVAKIEKKQQKRNPYPPFITATLQQAAASKFKFSASKTMKAAQSLYQDGHITYMRTDSVRSSPAAIDAARKWIKNNGYKASSKVNQYTNKDKSQDAHEAIRPTNADMHPDNLYASDIEVSVYRLVWERFIASQMEPAVYDTVSVTVSAKGKNKHELKASGRTLIYKGWLEIAKDYNSKSEEDSIVIPPLKEKDNLILVKPGVISDKKQTKPPARYSEASLIKELKKNGVGRPSTYAAIMDKIKERGYVISKKNVFQATDVGKSIVDNLSKYFKFMNYDYTADMESQLDKIADGSLDYVKMLSTFWDVFKLELREAYEADYTKTGESCDKCGKDMIVRSGRFGYFAACTGYPECKFTKTISKIDGDNIIIKKEVEHEPGASCPKCNGPMTRRVSAYGPFLSCVNYPKCRGASKAPFGKKCPKCNNELFINMFGGVHKLGCMGYPNCKHIEDIPKNAKLDWKPVTELQPTKKRAAHRKVLKSTR